MDIVDILCDKCSNKVLALENEYRSLKTRAHPGLINHLKVQIHGRILTLSQLSSVTTPDARTIKIQVYDRSYVQDITRAITKALGLSPQPTGAQLIVQLPHLTQERRVYYTKKAKEYAENAKVVVRGYRKESNTHLKKKNLAKDTHNKVQQSIDKQVRKYSQQIDSICQSKQKEIMSL